LNKKGKREKHNRQKPAAYGTFSAVAYNNRKLQLLMEKILFAPGLYEPTRLTHKAQTFSYNGSE